MKTYKFIYLSICSLTSVRLTVFGRRPFVSNERWNSDGNVTHTQSTWMGYPTQVKNGKKKSATHNKLGGTIVATAAQAASQQLRSPQIRIGCALFCSRLCNAFWVCFHCRCGNFFPLFLSANFTYITI